MKVKKTVSMLVAAAMLGGAAHVFADSDPFLRSPARLAYERQVAQDSGAYDGGYRGPVYHQPRAYRGHPAYRGQPVYQARPAYQGHPAYAYHGQPVYEAPVYAPQPAYAPAPYYVERRDNSAAILGGAAIGAVLGSQIGDRHSRPATTAIGAVLGAIIGSEF